MHTTTRTLFPHLTLPLLLLLILLFTTSALSTAGRFDFHIYQPVRGQQYCVMECKGTTYGDKLDRTLMCWACLDRLNLCKGDIEGCPVWKVEEKKDP